MSAVGKAFKKIKNDGIVQTFKWGINSLKIRAEQRRSVKRFDFDPEPVKDGTSAEKRRRAVVLATVPYYDIGGGQRSAQIAATLDVCGFSVFYLYAFKSSDIRSHGIELPLSGHRLIDSITPQAVSDFVREGDLLIAEAPCAKFLPHLEAAKAKGCRIVYENIDNWESSLGRGIYDEKTLEEFLRSADLLTATARPLVGQLEGKLKEYAVEKEVLYSPNAVNDGLFNPAGNFEKPADLVTGEKTFIYYGSLWGEWFDWDTVFALAKSRPSYSFYLIGDASGIEEKIKNAPKNVYFPGVKRQSELPAYLAWSDGALLPFKVDGISEYVSPLKVFEYIAMNSPVLSGRLPEVEGYPLVTTYDGKDDAVSKIDSLTPDGQAASEFLARNNWFSRTDAMIAKLYERDAAPTISVVVLNYNNSKVIFRCLDTLIAHNSYGYEVIVVDNCSGDGSYEKLIEDYSDRVKILRNTKNGCSSGRNLGVRNSEGEYIVFLDSDQWVRSDFWLDSYLEISKFDNFGCAAWGAGWFNDSGHNYRVADSYPHRYCEPPVLAKTDIGCLATCGFLIPRKIFDEIGGFDEAYDPTCYEDSDLSLAVRHAGYDIYYSVCLSVGHLPHQTTKEGSEAHAKLIKEKGDYFAAKWKKKDPDLLKYIKY